MKEKDQRKLGWIIAIALSVFITSLLTLFLLFNIRQQLLQIQQNPNRQNTTINKESHRNGNIDTPPESIVEEVNKFGVWEIREGELEKLLGDYDRIEETIKKLMEQRKQEMEKLENFQAQP